MHKNNAYDLHEEENGGRCLFLVGQNVDDDTVCMHGGGWCNSSQQYYYRIAGYFRAKFCYFCGQSPPTNIRSHAHARLRVHIIIHVYGHITIDRGHAIALFLYLRVLTVRRVLCSSFFYGKSIANACVGVHNTSPVQSPVAHAHTFRSHHEYWNHKNYF